MLLCCAPQGTAFPTASFRSLPVFAVCVGGPSITSKTCMCCLIVFHPSLLMLSSIERTVETRMHGMPGRLWHSICLEKHMAAVCERGFAAPATLKLPS